LLHCPTYLKIFILLAAPAAADGTGVNHRYDDGKFRRVGEEMTLCSAVLFPGPPDLSGIYPAAVGGTQDEGITQDPQLLVKTGQQVNKHPFEATVSHSCDLVSACTSFDST
jgi:hypothetical protein